MSCFWATGNRTLGRSPRLPRRDARAVIENPVARGVGILDHEGVEFLFAEPVQRAQPVMTFDEPQRAVLDAEDGGRSLREPRRVVRPSKRSAATPEKSDRAEDCGRDWVNTPTSLLESGWITQLSPTKCDLLHSISMETAGPNVVRDLLR
jgi:hypothetical protein